MNNLSLAVSIIFPLCCMMALGYVLKAMHVFDHLFLGKVNKLCFNVFLPLLLFVNIYQSDFFGLFSLKLVLFAIGLIFIAFIFLILIIPKIEKNSQNRGVLVQGIFRSNYILFGVPIAQGLYGKEHVGTTVLLIAFAIPLFNALSVVALSIYSRKVQSRNAVISEILYNPLIIASFIAFVFVATKIQLPDVVENTLIDLAKIATPLALIALGGSFQFQSIHQYKKQILIGVLGKLVVLPGIFICISILVGYRDIELTALMAMFASPTAVSTFTMAKNAKANDTLAGQIVIFTSIASVLTIFLWIVILKHLYLI